MAKEDREKAAAIARKREQRPSLKPQKADEEENLKSSGHSARSKPLSAEEVVKEREEIVKEICEAEAPKREIPKLSEEEARKAALDRVRQHRRKHDGTAPDHLEEVRAQLFERRDKRIEKFQQDQETKKEREKTNASSSSRPASAKSAMRNENVDEIDFEVREDRKPSVPAYQKLRKLTLSKPEIEKEKSDEISYAERHGTQSQKFRSELEKKNEEAEKSRAVNLAKIDLAETAKEKVYVPVELMQSDDSGILDKIQRESQSSPTKKLAQGPLAQTGVGVQKKEVRQRQ